MSNHHTVHTFPGGGGEVTKNDVKERADESIKNLILNLIHAHLLIKIVESNVLVFLC